MAGERGILPGAFLAGRVGRPVVCRAGRTSEKSGWTARAGFAIYGIGDGYRYRYRYRYRLVRAGRR